METFLRDLLVKQTQQGIDAQAIVHQTKKSIKTTRGKETHAGVQLQIIRVARWFTIAFAPISPTFPFALWSLIRSHKPDIIHIHSPNLSAFWLLLLPEARKIPWVVHWQSDVVASSYKWTLRTLYTLYRIPESYLLDKAVQIIATSDNYLMSSAPLRDHLQKSTVIPLGRDFPSPPPVFSGNSSSGEPLRVLSVCRLSYYKGLAHLLRAVSEIDAIQLTVVGDGEDRGELLELAKSLDLTEKFRHIARCNNQELLALYRSHHVFCLPSIERTEAFGVVLIEAMSQGLPCIVTDVPGTAMKWIVDPPRCGFVVKAGDAQALSRCLAEIRDNCDILNGMRDNAISRYKQHFDMKSCHEKVLDLYERIVTNLPGKEDGEQKPH